MVSVFSGSALVFLAVIAIGKLRETLRVAGARNYWTGFYGRVEVGL